MGGVGVKDVDAQKFINAYAAFLKRQGKLPSMRPAPIACEILFANALQFPVCRNSSGEEKPESRNWGVIVTSLTTLPTGRMGRYRQDLAYVFPLLQTQGCYLTRRRLQGAASPEH
jgi:hypothetical protein